MDAEPKLPLSATERRAAEKRSPPNVGVVYETVRREGQNELERGPRQLDAVTKLGYAMGFVIVIRARQQLFTENTLTPMLPLFINRDRTTVARLLCSSSPRSANARLERRFCTLGRRW